MISATSAWSPDVQTRIDAFVQRVERGEIEHPTAIFDFDGTLCREDIGENFLRWQIDNRKLRGVDYSRDVYGDYEAAVKRDHKTGYAMAVSLMKGLEEKAVRGWAADFARDHVDRHAFEAQRSLVDRLLKAGVDVWIVSASTQYLVEAAAPHFGLDPDHAVGIRAEVRDGILTGNVPEPITYREGKVDAIDRFIGRRPDLAAGNSWTDYEMLQTASTLAIMVNPSADLEPAARANGWAVQLFNPV